MERTNFQYIDKDSMHYRLGWLAFIGFGLIVIGMIALYAPYYSSFSKQYLICSFLLISGAMFVAHAFWARREGRFAPEVSIGFLYLLFGILVGLFAVRHPDSLIPFISIFFFLEGIQKFFFSLRLRPDLDWTWGLTSGIISVILGILMWALPFDLALVSVMVGIDLIESGAATIMISHSMRKTLESSGTLCYGDTCFSE